MNLQALEQEHKELGEKIERLKQAEGVWEPKVGDEHYRVGATGTVGHFSFNVRQTELIAHHNCYQTRTLAGKASILQRRANLIIQACLNFDPDFVPDWGDENQAKYGFYYHHLDREWAWDATGSIDYGAYVSTPTIADKVLAYLNSQEIK